MKNNFLKAVFDWNYLAAADCIAELRVDDPEPKKVSNSIRSSILAGIAEKKFDSVQRTRKRAEEICKEHHYEFAKPFVEAKTVVELREYVASIQTTEGWFTDWKRLFTYPDGIELNDEQIKLIKSKDSIIGWAVSNLSRRGILEIKAQEYLRAIYREDSSEASKSVRWRVVHVLGACPNAQNVIFLLDAVRQDTYHWVQYGAARSLVEIAARSEGDLRLQVITGLTKFLAEYHPEQMWIKRQIIREIMEAAFIRNPKPNWKETIWAILVLIVEKEKDQTYQTILKNRLNEFKEYNESQ